MFWAENFFSFKLISELHGMASKQADEAERGENEKQQQVQFFKNGISCALGNVSSWGKCELTNASSYAAKTNINELALLAFIYTLLLAEKMVRGCKKCYHWKKNYLILSHLFIFSIKDQD